ncbi:hypothetical protein GCM10023185_13420 [Hymenobacter saemangeumensis]|uniref:Uncharacterized protein n=1 Tax=Hymenobacter saemangeumensis TaxID=1084522 RepID=A0ABP8I7P2_9BACT
MSQLTHIDLCMCLNELLPSAKTEELESAATVLLVMFKVAGTAPQAPAPKAPAKKPRRYTEKPIAQSQRLKL